MNKYKQGESFRRKALFILRLYNDYLSRCMRCTFSKFIAIHSLQINCYGFSSLFLLYADTARSDAVASYFSLSLITFWSNINLLAKFESDFTIRFAAGSVWNSLRNNGGRWRSCFDKLFYMFNEIDFFSFSIWFLQQQKESKSGTYGVKISFILNLLAFWMTCIHFMRVLCYSFVRDHFIWLDRKKCKYLIFTKSVLLFPALLHLIFYVWW